jgi:hypothetical protein
MESDPMNGESSRLGHWKEPEATADQRFSSHLIARTTEG